MEHCPDCEHFAGRDTWNCRYKEKAPLPETRGARAVANFREKMQDIEKRFPQSAKIPTNNVSQFLTCYQHVRNFNSLPLSSITADWQKSKGASPLTLIKRINYAGMKGNSVLCRTTKRQLSQDR